MVRSVYLDCGPLMRSHKLKAKDLGQSEDHKQRKMFKSQPIVPSPVLILCVSEELSSYWNDLQVI